MRLASVFSLHSYYEYEHGKHITFEVDDIKIKSIFYTLQNLPNKLGSRMLLYFRFVMVKSIYQI